MCQAPAISRYQANAHHDNHRHPRLINLQRKRPAIALTQPFHNPQSIDYDEAEWLACEDWIERHLPNNADTMPHPGNEPSMPATEFHWARLHQLSGPQFHRIMAARIAVFVVEQNCPYQDADEMDAHSWHLSALIDGRLAGYLRLVDPGQRYAEPSIGRVLTVTDFRRQGLGRVLMDAALRQAERLFPGSAIRISAQAYLLDFYRSYGFETVGEGYLEDGIPHWEMLRSGRPDEMG